MEKRLENFKNRLLKKIDGMVSYNEKLCYLNDQFIKADSKQEVVVLDMLKQLKMWG